MKHRRRRGALGCAVLAGALASCAAVASCRTAGLRRVFTSLDEEGNRKRSTFFTDTAAIFCVGELVSGRADITVESIIKAKKLYDPSSDSLVPAQGIAWRSEAAPGRTNGAFIAFQLGKAEQPDGRTAESSPYPVGTFTCELALDGEPEDGVDFEIMFPPCPVLPPVTGQICRDWVRAGSRCEDAASRPCVCDEASGAWQCD
jgi:hypothetical protein